MRYCAICISGIYTSHHTRRPGCSGVRHCGRVRAGWCEYWRGGGDCHTEPGYKSLGIDGGGGCGVYDEREKVVVNR